MTERFLEFSTCDELGIGYLSNGPWIKRSRWERLRWISYYRIKQAVIDYNNLDDAAKSKTSLAHFIHSGNEVREYLADHEKYQDIDVSLDDWLASSDEDRKKDKRQAERVHKMKQSLQNKAG